MDDNSRTVIIVGENGSGKSTIANLLLNGFDNPFCVHLGVTSNDKEILFHNGQLNIGHDLYNVKVIEIPSSINDIDTIKSQMSEAKINRVNLILFVFKHGRLSETQISTLKCKMKMFSDNAKMISAIILTHCESLSDDARRATVDDFAINKDTEEIYNHVHKRLYTVGFPNMSNLPREQVESIKLSAKIDKEKLHELIKDSDIPCRNEDLFDDTSSYYIVPICRIFQIITRPCSLIARCMYWIFRHLF